VAPKCDIVATLKVDYRVSSVVRLAIKTNTIGRVRFTLSETQFALLESAGVRGIPASVTVVPRWAGARTKHFVLRI
jgi:hypothetical protein